MSKNITTGTAVVECAEDDADNDKSNNDTAQSVSTRILCSV